MNHPSPDIRKAAVFAIVDISKVVGARLMPKLDGTAGCELVCVLTCACFYYLLLCGIAVTGGSVRVCRTCVISFVVSVLKPDKLKLVSLYMAKSEREVGSGAY